MVAANHFSFVTASHCVTLMMIVSLSTNYSCQGLPQTGRKAGGQGRSGSTDEKDLCATPSSKSGSCMPLVRCRSYWGRNMPDLTNSSCGGETSLRVCCPLSEDDETTLTTEASDTAQTSRTRVTTVSSLEEMHSGDRSRRTGFSIFPENCGESRGTLRRIVGGQDSTLGAWPWMAAIYLVRRSAKSAECGGVLITLSHVLTAAHCIVTSRRGRLFSPSQLLVRLGDLDLASENDGANPIDVKVRTIIKHDGFSLRTFQNDIAILELAQSVKASNTISPICLPFNTFLDEDLTDRNGIATGWGSIEYNGPASSHLQEVQLRIWSNNLCRDVFRRDVPITNANLCAGDGDKDACRGDSGGPLKLADSRGRYYLIGIVSFGKKCAEPGIPGVYTRITTFLNWIEENIG